jgi:hypothetical protein
MAITFKKINGKAKKGGAELLTLVDGDNTFRMVGDIVARYNYWVQGSEGKNLPMECVGFDRESESFKNLEKDWVRHYFPELKCSWAYAVMAIDRADGKLKLLNLKKKMFEQILTVAEELGDPTDTKTGWDITVNRKKTGPLAFNVEYTVKQMKIKAAALSAADLELIAELKPIDQIVVRPTSDEQKTFIESNILGNKEEDTSADVMEEFESAEDLG